MKVAAFIVCLLFAIVTLLMGLDKTEKQSMRIFTMCAGIIFMAAAITMAYRGF